MSRSSLHVERYAGGDVRILRSGDAPDGRGHLGFRTLSRGPDSARVALVAEGALLLAGDDIRLAITVGAGVSLEIVEPTGTVAFDMRGGSARWSADVSVADGAELLWYAEPLVIATGACVSRQVRVQLSGDAVYRGRETLVWGRVGEVGGRLSQSTYVADDLGPLLSETLVVDGGRPQLGVLEGARVMDTVSCFGALAPDVPDGALRYDLERSGTLIRSLLTQTHESRLVSPSGPSPAVGQQPEGHAPTRPANQRASGRRTSSTVQGALSRPG